MAENMTAIDQTVKSFILQEFLPGEDPAELTDSTALMTTGIVDSIATLKLVTFLEETYGITVEPHEADSENLNTIALIRSLVSAKLAKRRPS
ncbi:MAG: acyl carrier protein [Planctomycetota bacterium]